VKTDRFTSAYRFRIYPNTKQQRMLLVVLELCRRLYNYAVCQRKDTYKATGRTVHYEEQQNQLPQFKDQRPEYEQAHSQVLQDALRRVERAFTGFLEGRTRYPKYKKHGQCRSITFPQISNENIGSNSIILPKIGRVRMTKHRPIKGKPKTLTITLTKSGEWYTSITTELNPPNNNSNPRIIFNNPIGVDSGLVNYLYLSDGEHVDNPRFISNHAKRIIKAQKELSRKKRKVKRVVNVNGNSTTLKVPGSNWLKAKTILARRWRDYVNAKEDWQWKQANRLVNKHDFIGYENLPIRNMLKNHCLARAIQDAAWAGFWEKVESKAATAASTTTQKVPPQYTTQRCSKCGYKHKVALSERSFMCPNCGHFDDRDHNSSDVVLSDALQLYYKAFEKIVGMDVPEFTPAEIEPLPPNAEKPMMVASSIAETGNKFHTRVDEPGRGITRAEAHGFSNGRTSQPL